MVNMPPTLWNSIISRTTLGPRSIGDNLGLGAQAEVILPALTSLVVIARLSLRRKYGIALKWDDYTIALANVFSWGGWAAWFYVCRYVVPTTIPKLPAELYNPFLKGYFVSILFYAFANQSMKVSILLFYHRAFGTTRKVRIWTYVLQGVFATVFVLGISTILFVCVPTSNFWLNPTACDEDPWVAVGTAWSAAGLASDIVLLAFPIPFIWGLRNMSVRKKVAICGVFSMGLVSIASYAGQLILLFGEHLSLTSKNFIPAIMLCAAMNIDLATLTACLPPLYRPVQLFAASCGRRFSGSASEAPTTPTQGAAQPKKRPGVTTWELDGVTATSIIDTESQLDTSSEGRI